MGFFDGLFGKKNEKIQRRIDPKDIPAAIASTIDGVFTEMGPHRLFRDDFHIVLSTQNSVSGYWGNDPESQPNYEKSVRLAELQEFESLKDVLSWESYSGLAPDKAKKFVTQLWSLLGHEMVDKLAIAIWQRL